ncbi:MAG: DUF2155 domain-containing protein [Nitrospirae bacterium]|nr:MAG: DUF2155 domain-containing protein [Nitrospirota bacterium]
MKRKILAVACSLTLLVAVSACKKKQEQPAPQTGVPGQQQPLPPGHPAMNQPGPGGVVMPKGETTISLPDAVKGKWKAVVLVVEDKASKKKSEFTVNLNSDLKIPNSDLKVTVGDFLPDFKMDGLAITSTTNDPNNPAVKVVVFEKDKEVFKGWLYSKFPTIHPFEHPKFGLMLKSGVKKG